MGPTREGLRQRHVTKKEKSPIGLAISDLKKKNRGRQSATGKNIRIADHQNK